MQQPDRDRNPRLIRVLEIPGTFPDGFRFGGGEPITFSEVDWFQDALETPVGLIFQTEAERAGRSISTPEGRAALREFIVAKPYYQPDRAYLVLSSHGVFTIGYGEAP